MRARPKRGFYTIFRTIRLIIIFILFIVFSRIFFTIINVNNVSSDNKLVQSPTNNQPSLPQPLSSKDFNVDDLNGGIDDDDDQQIPAAVDVQDNRHSKGEEIIIQGKQNLCIGMATGLSHRNLLLFVKSFRRFVPNPADGNIILFVDNKISNETLSFLQKNHVHLIYVNPDTINPAEIRHFHASNSRYFILKDYLTKLDVTEDSLILLIDVKDVLFQANPFDLFKAIGAGPEGGVWATLENENKKLGECKYNSRWVRACYGDAGLKPISNNTISCSGATFATAKYARIYLKLMTQEMLLHKECEFMGTDQGIHNYLLRNNKIPGVHLIKLNDGIIAHMHHMKRDVDFILAENTVYLPTTNPGLSHGKAFLIVHQYNRHKEFKQELYDSFSANTS